MNVSLTGPQAFALSAALEQLDDDGPAAAAVDVVWIRLYDAGLADRRVTVTVAEAGLLLAAIDTGGGVRAGARMWRSLDSALTRLESATKKSEKSGDFAWNRRAKP